MDGETYRMNSTIRDNMNKTEAPHVHSYQATKIELLDTSAETPQMEQVHPVKVIKQLYYVVVVFRVAKSEDSQALIVDINSVQSIYLKDNVQGILDWINKDCLRVAVDETKLSAALTNSSPIPLTLPKQLIALMVLQR